MVRTVDEIMEALRLRVGDAADDDTLAFIEDVSDTLGDLSGKAASENEWQQKYEENDRAWREKYRDRFFEGYNPEEPAPDPEEPHDILTFEELFKEEK